VRAYQWAIMQANLDPGKSVEIGEQYICRHQCMPRNRIAELEGLSLNHYMVTTIARAIGHEAEYFGRKPRKKEKQLA